MELITVLHKLTNEHKYKNVVYKEELSSRLREQNLEVWINNQKCMITKEYTSKAQLNNWYIDQIVISFIYDVIEAKYRNNLYFLLVINLNENEKKEISFLINEIEKDYKVCRKYTILSLEDLQRVPSLNSNFGHSDNAYFDFDNEFKKDLFKTEDIEGNNDFSKEIKEIVDTYFEFYDEPNDEERNKVLEQTLISMVNKNEN
ncbi:hypothetical protein P6709_18440 [Jeotgalibacillus sp. ET6]|uniref:ABC-three component system middle component 1 n=1 Tax=Jeotgalibacillus sp. ET6 TaxID=3037260 RepID=UPI0024185725|nr:ABC-three component system middle component 1 [Jeotgalibacillus sp. ET6]MDG5473711.1 hypothetical protein [Jeotgalibacillus sp. ET6]